MAGLGTGAGAPVVKVYHEKSMILPDVSRVLACLYEKNVEFETVKDSYKDILRLQSTRSVPVPFYDGPTFRQESRAICRYIAETYEQRGYPFLLGKDVLERASIEQWLRHEEHAFDPPSRALFCHLAFPLHDEDMSDIDREKRKLEEVLEVYEQRLGESEFLAGNKFTLADLVHLPNTHHIVTSEKFAYLYDSRKNVQRWWNTISARDSWQQVVRDMQSVEEQNQIEELEQQQLEEQWQWETEPPQTSGRRILRIDPRQQTGTKSRTILVPPPSDGNVSSSFFTVQQEQQPLHTETTSHGETSPNQRRKSNFFTTTQKTPAPSKQRTPTIQEPPSSVKNTTSNFFTPATTTIISPKTDTDKASSKDASSPTKSSQSSSKEIPDDLHRSDLYKASRHNDEASTHTKPTPQDASRTSDRVFQARQTGEAVPPNKSNQGSPTSVQSTTSNFFTPSTTTKMPQRTNTDKSTSKDASSPTRPSQGSSNEAPDKLHLSDFYKASSHTDETAKLTKLTPKEASKTSDRISAPRQISEVVAPDKPSPASPKNPRGIDGPDFYETEKKHTSVNPWLDSPIPYTNPDDSQTPRSPYTRPARQGAAGTSGPEAGERPSNQRSVVQTPFAQQPSEQAKKATADQRAASQLPEHVADKDIQGETAPQVKYRDAKDSTKEAREAGQKRAAPATTRELPPGSQNISQQSKAPPTSLKASDLSPVQEDYEDTQGEDERFSTKRLRKMLEQSDPAALKSQSTDGRGDSATETRKLLSINEQQLAPPMPSQTPTTAGVDRREQPHTPNKTSTEQSDKSDRQTPPADTRRTSASTPPAPLQAPASDGRSFSTALQGGIADARRENEAITNPRDQPSDQAPPSSSFADRRNMKTDIDEASQTATVTPDEQPGGRVPKNSVNKPISSKDNGKQTNETVHYSSSETSREMAPPVSEKRMGQQKTQSDKSSISPQGNGKQGSEAAVLTNADEISGKTPGQALQESQQQTSLDTQQVKNNRSNSTSDGSSKPT